MKFDAITDENHKEAYKFALSPYGRLKEDLVKISEACRIPKISLSMAQNTFIYRRLMIDSSTESMKKLAADLLIKDIAPIRQCKKLMGADEEEAERHKNTQKITISISN